MSKVSEMTREKWIMSTFPEWGTWLVEDIENEVVQPGNVAMWWLGCTGIWFKTPGGANITIDLWCGNGKRTHGDGKMKVGHQMANMCGGRLMQPNLRNVPFVIDPFAFKHVDAVLATHYHQDHMSAEWAAHVIQSGMTTIENGKEVPVPFIGPLKSVETWMKWGVPEDRCRIVKPGDVISIGDTIMTTNTNDNIIVIGIDHGFGNIKTANTVFKTGVTSYDKEPIFRNNLLIYNGRFYQIGEEHKEFTADKIQDEDYYILTLAAIARELHIRGLTTARVHIAAGLPLTWVSGHCCTGFWPRSQCSLGSQSRSSHRKRTGSQSKTSECLCRQVRSGAHVCSKDRCCSTSGRSGSPSGKGINHTPSA